MLGMFFGDTVYNAAKCDCGQDFIPEPVVLSQSFVLSEGEEEERKRKKIGRDGGEERKEDALMCSWNRATNWLRLALAVSL